MAFPSISDARVQTDAALDQDLMEDLVERDEWNQSGNASGSASHLEGLYNTGHSHDGTSGEGAQIPTAGIADGGVNLSDQIPNGDVTNAKVASSTMNTTNFDDGAVTPAKMSGTMGGSGYSGSSTSEMGVSVGHSLGRKPVPCNIRSGDFVVESVSSSSVTVRKNSRTIGFGATWNYDFDLC